jgi:hypothetical protein
MCRSPAKRANIKLAFLFVSEAWDKAALYMLIFNMGTEGSLKITPLASLLKP